MWPCVYIAICSTITAFNDCIIVSYQHCCRQYTYAFIVCHVHNMRCVHCAAYAHRLYAISVLRFRNHRRFMTLRVNAIPFEKLNQSAACAILCTQSRVWYVDSVGTYVSHNTPVTSFQFLLGGGKSI